MNEDGRTNVVKCQQSINLCEGSQWEFLPLVLHTLVLSRKLLHDGMRKKRKGRNDVRVFGMAMEEEW